MQCNYNFNQNLNIFNGTWQANYKIYMKEYANTLEKEQIALPGIETHYETDN